MSDNSLYGMSTDEIDELVKYLVKNAGYGMPLSGRKEKELNITRKRQ